jgi:hypothetical protein
MNGIKKDLERRCSGLTEELSRHLTGETEKNHENPQSG